MAELVLVRHGESEANADGIIQGRVDYPLSGRGREQAMRTAAALSDFRPYRIYTSPLLRALETAEIINRPHNCEVKILDDLIEYDLGEFEGLTFKQVLEKTPDLKQRLQEGIPFHHLAPGAETDSEVEKRAARALEEILNSGLPRAMVVSHMGILERMIQGLEEKYPGPPLPLCTSLPLRNCSITRLSCQPLTVEFLCVNDISHLP